MDKKKEYFCEKCFENVNIKQFIRENGKEIQTQYECTFSRSYALRGCVYK